VNLASVNMSSKMDSCLSLSSLLSADDTWAAALDCHNSVCCSRGLCVILGLSPWPVGGRALLGVLRIEENCKIKQEKFKKGTCKEENERERTNGQTFFSAMDSRSAREGVTAKCPFAMLLLLGSSFSVAGSLCFLGVLEGWGKAKIQPLFFYILFSFFIFIFLLFLSDLGCHRGLALELGVKLQELLGPVFVE